ncbi:MAG: hypothetical protein WBG29_09745 [Candidatus Acidiferrales bacterium]
MPAVVPGEEELPPNVFQGSLAVSSNYDDNVFPTVSPRQWNVTYSILPQVSFEETRQRVEWKFAYTPGVEISQRAFYRNVFSQRFNGNFVWLVSPHGTLTAEQYYSVSTSPFGDSNGISPGPIISPNETIYLPNVRQTYSLSHVLYSYQSSAQTTMGFGGSYLLQGFDSIPQSGVTTPLIHAQVVSGEAYIAHNFTARNQLGFQYGLQVLKFQQTDARTTTHSFEVFDQINFSSHSVLTVYGGPEYSLTASEVVLNLGFVLITIPVNANQWSASGGVVYKWTGDRLAASIDVSRRVSDGGALIGSVELTTGKARFAWQFTRNWSLTSTIAGADDQLLAGASSGSNELLTYSGQVGLRRQLGRDFAIDWFYERLNQTGNIDGFEVGNHDIFGASLRYSFLKPVGR